MAAGPGAAPRPLWGHFASSAQKDLCAQLAGVPVLRALEKPGCLATAAQAAGTLGGGGGRSPLCLSVSWFLSLPLSFDRLSPSVSLRVSLCLCAPPPSLSPSVLFPDPPVHTLRQVQTTYWAPGPRAGNTMTSSTPPRGSLCLSPLADEEAEAGSHQVTRPHKLGPPVLGCRREDQGWRLRPRDGRWLTGDHTAVSRRPRRGASLPSTLPGSRETT